MAESESAPEFHGAHSIVVAERVSSIFSVLGAFFIITTFLCDPRFRKPINRLVFYASWGNLFANVATLISRTGIALGVNAPLCQFQGFLIQWFMPADALWTFAMACNVFLTFFKQYDAAALRTLEWRYLVLCYGLPFVPAFVFCFIHTEEKGKFYGSANLWCWVSAEWNVFRIATFYGPVWIIIVANVFIYVKVGAVVFKWRRQLISLNRSLMGSNPRESSGVTISVPMSQMRSPPATKTYEVSIVSQVPHHSPSRSKHLSLSSPTTVTHSHQRFPSTNTTTIDEHTDVQRRTTIVHPTSKSTTHRVVDANRATISYCYTALLFFLALLVTWVPSSVNRVYTLISPDSPSPFALDFASSLVLPLQGFWNTVIYIVTSHAACKALASDLRDRSGCYSRRGRGPSTQPGLPPGVKRHAAQLGSTDTSESERDRERRQQNLYNHDRIDHRDFMRSPEPTHLHPQAQTYRDRNSGSSLNEHSSRTRADIVISFDGKKRVVQRGYGSDTPESQYHSHENRQEEARVDSWAPTPRSSQDEDLGKTRLYGSAGGDHSDSSSSSEIGDARNHAGAKKDGLRVSKIGFAR